MEIKEILESIGYQVLDAGTDYYKMRPLYRESNNPTLNVNKKTGYYRDWVTGESGSLAYLVKLSLGLADIKESYEYLEKEFEFAPKSVIHVPKIKIPPKFDESFVKSLEKDSSYWLGRGISQEVIDEFEGGVHKKTNRYYFIIRNGQNEIVGLAGRSLGDSKVKWRLSGSKKLWNFPLSVNHFIIKETREVILLESIGDCLSCFTAGIRNCMVCFGVDLSNEMITTLIKMDLKKIYISFNNDSAKNGAGNIAAEKTRNRLLRYFDERVVKLAIPPNHNDLNDWLIKGNKQEIIDFYAGISTIKSRQSPK